MTKAKFTVEPGKQEVRITRDFDAPRDLIFKAFTDPKHIPNWWGPAYLTTVVEKMDVRPGGVWRFMMHGPDGTDYPNKVSFIEVERPARLVYLHGDDKQPDQFHVTVTSKLWAAKPS